MDKKASFILFHDHLDSVLPELTMEQRGMLLTALNSHSHDRKYVPHFDSAELSGLRIAYSIMASALDINAEKYEQRCRTNAANRAKGSKYKITIDDDREGSRASDDDSMLSRSDTGTGTDTETDTETGTGTGDGPAPSEPAIKFYGLYHNVRLTDEEYKDILSRVEDPEGRINKYSKGLQNGWKGYDASAGDHYIRIIQYAEKDGYIKRNASETQSSSLQLNLNSSDRKRITEIIGRAFGDKGLVREAIAVYNIREDDSRPTSPGTVELIEKHAKLQNPYSNGP